MHYLVMHVHVVHVSDQYTFYFHTSWTYFLRNYSATKFYDETSKDFFWIETIKSHSLNRWEVEPKCQVYLSLHKYKRKQKQTVSLGQLMRSWILNVVSFFKLQLNTALTDPPASDSCLKQMYIFGPFNFFSLISFAGNERIAPITEKKGGPLKSVGEGFFSLIYKFEINLWPLR